MSAQKEIYIIGAGGHAKVVIRMLQDLGYRVAAVFDDNLRLGGAYLLSCPIVSPIERIGEHARRPAIIAIGDNATRRRIADRYDMPWMTAVHPLALVDPSVRLGCGTVVLARAVVQVDSWLGDHVIVNHATTVDHDCTVGDGVHLAPGVHLAGGVTVHEGAFMGVGAVAIPAVRIGARTIVGAGAVVTRNLPEEVVAAGVPARIIKPAPRAAIKGDGGGFMLGATGGSSAREWSSPSNVPPGETSSVPVGPREIPLVLDFPGHVGLGSVPIEP